MAHFYELTDLQSGYVRLVNEVIRHGEPRSPRGADTLDLGNVTFTLTDPRLATPVSVGRQLNLTLASAESAQLVAGVSDIAQLISVTPAFKAFSVNHRQPGAYGPRICDQMLNVVSELATDPDSRRAEAVVFRAGDLARDNNPDVPCTLAFGWHITRGRLNMNTVMRSNDVWLGVPYDVTMMTRLQLTLAWALGVKVGTYTHQTFSLHLYTRDLERARQLHEPERIVESPIPAFVPDRADTRPGLRNSTNALKRWLKARERARYAVLDLPTSRLKLSSSAAWHWTKLQPHVSGGLRCKHCNYVLPRTADHFHSHVADNQFYGVCVSCRRAMFKRSPAQQPLARLERRCAQYGVTVEWFNDRLKTQGGVCAICQREPDNGRWRDFVVDHDHETGQARGLLCSKCNHALGLLRDSEHVALRASSYLRGEL